MEAASEKRGRGRPRSQPSVKGAPAALFPQKTLRGRTNYMFAVDALSIIGCDAENPPRPTPFPHLVDWIASETRQRGAVKFGVLTELGRASREVSADVVRLMAERLNEALADGRLVTARDAELQAREWRKLLRAP